MKINFKYILHLMGIIILLESLFIALDIPVTLIYHDGDFNGIFLSFFVAALIGTILYFSTRKGLEKEILPRERYILVTFSWLILCFVGTLPYLFNHTFHSFSDTLFETISGFTTTGASVLQDVESLPHGVLFWRSETHWIGGMGIIVLVVAILPTIKSGGLQLFFTESSLQTDEKLAPRIIEVAKRLWIIYMLLTVAEIILLSIEGMPLFDSICHSFGTIATGGFSTKNSSLAGYSSAIQITVTIFMLLSGMNFTLHYYAMRGKFGDYFKNEELLSFLGITLVAGSIVTIVLYYQLHKPIFEAMRNAFFQVVSIITCTGFATDDYVLWPSLGMLIILTLMFIGASTGSTGGGIKVYRYLVLMKKIRFNIRNLAQPLRIPTLRYNKKPLPEQTVGAVLNYILLYLFVAVIGIAFLHISGLDIRTSLGSSLTAMAGIGPGLGTTGPVANYAHLTDFAKITMCFLMLVGRLEIFSVIILFSPTFWKL